MSFKSLGVAVGVLRNKTFGHEDFWGYYHKGHYQEQNTMRVFVEGEKGSSSFLGKIVNQGRFLGEVVDVLGSLKLVGRLKWQLGIHF